MKLTLISLALLFSSGLVSATPPKKPSKPTPTTVVNQSNACGNNATPYCCSTDGKGGYASCYAMSASSQCSQTIVCCNANNSVQTCIGNANIDDDPYW